MCSMTTDDADDVAPVDPAAAPMDDPSLRAAGWDGDDIAEMQGDWEYERDHPHRELGDAVEKARSVRGWTAQEAAKRAKIAYKTWLRIEHGAPVRNATLMKLDDLFDLEPGTALDMWQRGDTKGLEAALAPASNRSSDKSIDAEIERLIEEMPARLQADPTTRLQMTNEALLAIMGLSEERHQPRAIYEMLVLLLNFLDRPALDEVGHLLAVAKEVRAWEATIGFPVFSARFAPDSAKYAKVNDPWSEYVGGEFAVNIIHGRIAQMTEDQASKVSQNLRENPVNTRQSESPGD